MQALNRAARRGHVESGSISVSCGWRSCGRPVALEAPDIKTASDALWAHYRAEHGGEQPQEPGQ
jgi:hypothetical protein